MPRCDDLQNGYRIWQDPGMFCFGVDAVLLGHYPRLRDGDRILDLCTGFAPVPLILSARARDLGIAVSITGIEIEERAVELARLSVKDNGLEGQVRIVTGDIREAVDRFGAASFSLVTSNPPYMPVNGGLVGADPVRAAARTEIRCTLRDVVSSAAKLLVPGGRFAMIHRPFRLPEIFEALSAHKLEAKRMRLIQPFAGKEPNMVMIEARKNAKRRLTIEPPLIVRNDDGEYTAEIQQIYNN